MIGYDPSRLEVDRMNEKRTAALIRKMVKELRKRELKPVDGVYWYPVRKRPEGPHKRKI